MTTITRTRKPAETIKAASIARYTDRATGKLIGFGVKSNSGTATYCVKCVAEDVYTCECEAKEWGYAGRCKHILAVKELVAARRQNELDAAAVVAPLVLGSFSEDLQAHLDDSMPEQDNESDGELGALAWAIVADEMAAKAEQIRKVQPARYLRFCAINGVKPAEDFVNPPFERRQRCSVPSGAFSLMR